MTVGEVPLIFFANNGFQSLLNLLAKYFWHKLTQQLTIIQPSTIAETMNILPKLKFLQKLLKPFIYLFYLPFYS